MKLLGELASEVRGLSLAAYKAKFPAPALLLQAATLASSEKIDTPTEGDDGGITMKSKAVDPIQLAAQAATDVNAALVFFLAKSGRNPFSSMITIGRARNNDVLIESGLVSKLHAYVLTRPDGLFIFDQGSTNGTKVDGVMLKKGEGGQLRDGCTIELAPNIALRYHTVETLFSLIRQRSPAR